MAWRDWALPLGFGLIGGLVAAALPFGDGSGPSEGLPEPQGTDWEATGWVFTEGPRVAGLPSEVGLLFIGPESQPLQTARSSCFVDGPEDCVIEPNCPAEGGCNAALTCGPPCTELEHAAGRIWTGRATDYRITCIRAPCDPPQAPFITRDAAPEEPRFGVAGHNATALAFHAFNAAGELVASNAPDTELARFLLADGFLDLPDAAWYLGENATTPSGTLRLPAPLRPILEGARPLLLGLPVGGVATTTYSHPLLGELWLTARVDRLLLAP